MARRLYANNARCRLGSDISTTNSITEIVLETGKGSLFPLPSGGNFFILTITDALFEPECFEIDGRIGDILSVSARAQEGTIAKALAANHPEAFVRLNPTKGAFERLEDHVEGILDVHDASAISYAGASGLSADDVEEALDELDAEKASLASPALTGNPTAPTQAPGNNSTRLANTAFIFAALVAFASELEDDFLIHTTGDVKMTFRNVADTGWVLMNDGSIGNAASGATTRANADTVDLFTLLWNNVINTWAPVSGGRGANAADDFAANKTLTLPRALGRALAGFGAGSGLTSRALGEWMGVETVALTAAQNGPHTHTVPIIAISCDTNGGCFSPGGTTSAGAFGSTATDVSGSGSPHANVQPSLFVTVMVKL